MLRVWLEDLSNIFRSLWYMKPCVISSEVTWRFSDKKSKTLVQDLANTTDCEMQIPYDGNLEAWLLHRQKLTIWNPKSSCLSQTTADTFYI